MTTRQEALVAALAQEWPYEDDAEYFAIKAAHVEKRLLSRGFAIVPEDAVVDEAQEFASRAANLARTATEDDPAIQAFALVSIALSLARLRAAQGETP